MWLKVNENKVDKLSISSLWMHFHYLGFYLFARTECVAKGPC